jgi:hypothetical protein
MSECSLNDSNIEEENFNGEEDLINDLDDESQNEDNDNPKSQISQ